MKSFSNTTKVTFAALFTLLVFVSMKLNFSALMGAENQFFTIFQFFGPIAGGILGSGLGAAVVAAAQLFNAAVTYATGGSVELLTILRIAPMIFAAYYFGTRKKHASIVIPVLAIIAFISHPVGRQVWFYALFWTIPIIAVFFRNHLFARSLGATFTAHAVGGMIWIWTLQSSPEMWVTLIPIVVMERLLFAAGIAISYVAANTLLARVDQNIPLVNVDKKYILSKLSWKSL